MEIDLAFGRGPKADAAEKNFTYFVAVTRRNAEVIEKAEYTIPVNFGKNSVKLVEEEIKQILIPRKGEQTSGLNFEIVVGLALTPSQARFNRSGKSLKFPEL